MAARKSASMSRRAYHSTSVSDSSAGHAVVSVLQPGELLVHSGRAVVPGEMSC